MAPFMCASIRDRLLFKAGLNYIKYDMHEGKLIKLGKKIIQLSIQVPVIEHNRTYSLLGAAEL